MAAWAVRAATPFLIRPSPAEAGYGPRGHVHTEGVAEGAQVHRAAAFIALCNATRGKVRVERC